MPKKDGKPRGRMSSYAFFVQCCREEHKKKHPGENVVFAEFTKKCAQKWKVICDAFTFYCAFNNLIKCVILSFHEVRNLFIITLDAVA